MCTTGLSASLFLEAEGKWVWESTENQVRIPLDKRRGVVAVSTCLFPKIGARYFAQSALSMIDIVKGFTMIKKIGTVAENGKVAHSGDVKFVNYDLTEDEKKSFKKWAHENAAEFTGLLDKLIDDYYHLSVKWDTYNQCVSAFIICKNSKSENDGWILTGRGSTVFSAVMGALYRHYVLFESQWPTEALSRRAVLDDL